MVDQPVSDRSLEVRLHWAAHGVTSLDLDSLGSLTVTRIQAVDGVVRTLTCPIVNL